MKAAVGPPTHREVDVALRSGASIRLRPIRQQDEAAMLTFLSGLSIEARAFRFFTAGADLRAAARWATDIDYADRYGIVAVASDGLTILAHGMYIRDGADGAEVAFAVAGALQGEGIATTMLAHLAQTARGVGIERFVADVLPENHRIVDVFRGSGFEVTVSAQPGALIFAMPTELGAGAQRRYDERDAVAAAAAVARVLRPRAVAVVGASSRAGSVGGAILRNVLAARFTGEVHAVSTRSGAPEGVTAYRSVRDVPGELDLAVIAVPADAVLGVARDCAAKGVRALVVVSAGFGETDTEGRERQRELLSVCRAAGMRLVGPNCLGVMNTDPAVGLNATFGPVQPPRGRVAFMSQSGALGIAIVDALQEEGIGLSSFVSVGNKADISGNDLLAYWDRDAETDVILLYLESFGNPRRFSRVARDVGSRKPIVAVKGGRSPVGARAAGSHTGALLAASDGTVDALFAQAGVVRTETLGELFDVAGLLAAQPPPAGPRVGVVTNGGGLSILCADACQVAGLDVVATPDAVQRALRAELPAAAAVANPLDLLASASAAQFALAVDELAASGAVDSIIVLYVPPLVTDPEAIAVAVAATTSQNATPPARPSAWSPSSNSSGTASRFRPRPGRAQARISHQDTRIIGYSSQFRLIPASQRIGGAPSVATTPVSERTTQRRSWRHRLGAWRWAYGARVPRTRLYRKGVLQAEDFPAEEISEHLKDPEVCVWLDYCDPTREDLAKIEEELNLHELAIEAATGERQRPKLNRYDSHLFLSAYAVGLDVASGEIRTTEINAFITENALVTVRKDEGFDIDAVMRRWDESAELAEHGVSFLIWGLLDCIVDGHFDAVQTLDTEIEALEDLLFDDLPHDVEVQRRSFQLRKSLVLLRRVVVPMREVLNSLMRRDVHLLVEPMTPYYQDVYDHVLRATEWTESLRDLVTTILETNLTIQGNRMNLIMKKVTSWAAIIAVPTAITGFYGQNVPYPGFAAHSGFWVSSALILLLSGALYRGFRRRDWI